VISGEGGEGSWREWGFDIDFVRKTVVSHSFPAVYHTDKKENQIFLIYKEIQIGAVAKSYRTNGLLIYGEIFTHFLIY
jgi:hypothetical protein